MHQQTSHRPRWLADDVYGGEWNVCCPVCGFGYSHIKEVYTLRGSDEHEAGEAYRGTEIGGTTAERRNALAIVFEGECGHEWRLVIQQHKGVNLVKTQTWQ
jgi:adenine-specific DNA methylase